MEVLWLRPFSTILSHGEKCTMKTLITALALAWKLAVGVDAKAKKLPITDEKWVYAISAKHQ
ncbi:hypothetical protein ACCO45_013749 [Purpureocillium lilacinum]|uniref:Uncharacterized protein n=1 Tax=Purpureocillium lilacinum TaxID=33203 RepID=A0ACC4D7G6_PURLI